MFNLRNTAHSHPAEGGSRTGREIKVRMGLFPPLERNEWVSEERSITFPIPNPAWQGRNSEVLINIHCHLVAAYSICRLRVHKLAKSLTVLV